VINNIYSILLTITNATGHSRRVKILPPTKEGFAIASVKYPQLMPTRAEEDDPAREFGLIAPGMSVVIEVQFNASQFTEFEDSLTIVNDENYFSVPILARKESPLVVLPAVLDSGSCYVGDLTERSFRIENQGGESGFKFFSKSEAEVELQAGEALHVGGFLLFPAEFYLQKGEALDVRVQYRPLVEGQREEEIVLANDNGSSASYTLRGKGEMVEVDIFAIDGERVFEQPGQDPSAVVRLFFSNAFPAQKVARQLQI